MDTSLSPNTISEVLRDIGKDYASQKEFFDELMVDSKTLIFDLSSIFHIQKICSMRKKDTMLTTFI